MRRGAGLGLMRWCGRKERKRKMKLQADDATWIVPLIMLPLGIGIIAAAIIFGPEPEKCKVERTYALGGSIITVTHDGHMFVLFAGNGAGICHHPECKKCAGKE